MTTNDYSVYLKNKRVQVAQTGFLNINSLKSRTSIVNFAYFPLYKSIGLPINNLRSNKFLNVAQSSTPPIIFSPLDITGLNLWLDASDSNTITSANGLVSQWADKTTNAYNLTQSNNTYKPSYSSNTMSFSSDRNFDIPNDAINNAITYDLFILFRPKTSINYILGKQRDGNYTPLVLSMTKFVGGTGTNNVVYYRVVKDSDRPVGPYDTTTLNSSSALTLNSLQILGIHNSASNCLINKDGSTLSTNSTLRIGNTPTVTAFKLGALFGNGIFEDTGETNFDLCEMLFFNSGISLLNRQKVEGYLAWKWETQDSLPTNHPYKNIKP